MSVLWTISMRYMMSHKRQSLICVAGVAISVTMFISMFAMMQGFADKFIIETVESSGHMTVNDEPRESKTPLLELAQPDPRAVRELTGVKPREQVKQIKNPQGLMAKLRTLPGVVAVTPQVDGDAVLSYGSKTYAIAVQGIDPVEHQRVTTLGEKLKKGKLEDLYGSADGVILGSGVALVLGADLGDSVVVSSPSGGKVYSRVVGIFETGVTPVDYSRIYMLMSRAQTLLNKKNIVSRIVIRSDDYTKAVEYAAQIESISGYKTESWQEANANFLKIFQIQDMITFIITGALLVVAAFGVLNILIMAVMERINDIAIMKSFGFSRQDVTLIFVMQGLVIGVIGSSIGLVFAKLVIEGLRRVPVKVQGLVSAEGILVSENINCYIAAFVAAMLVTLVASVYPARRAAGYDPVDVIRGAH